MNPSIVIFDLDGTLAVSKSPLTRDMGTTLAALLETHTVAVMSGGSYAQFQKQFFPGMPATARYEQLYLFPTSAAQCYTFQDGDWHLIYDNSFSPAEHDRVMAALEESLKEAGFDVPPPQLWGPQTEDRGAQITWSALGQQAPVEVKSVWDPDRTKRAPLQAALIKRLPGFSVRVNATNSIDITREGINKAYGVRRLSELTGTPISNMVYVGDALFPGGNDEVVKETGVATHAVSGPADSEAFISTLLKA